MQLSGVTGMGPVVAFLNRDMPSPFSSLFPAFDAISLF